MQYINLSFGLNRSEYKPTNRTQQSVCIDTYNLAVCDGSGANVSTHTAVKSLFTPTKMVS